MQVYREWDNVAPNIVTAMSFTTECFHATWLDTSDWARGKRVLKIHAQDPVPRSKGIRQKWSVKPITTPRTWAQSRSYAPATQRKDDQTINNRPRSASNVKPMNGIECIVFQNWPCLVPWTQVVDGSDTHFADLLPLTACNSTSQPNSGRDTWI